MDDLQFPKDIETERQLLSAILVAPLAQRQAMIGKLRNDLFFDLFHQDVWKRLRLFRDYADTDLLVAMLDADMRKRWDSPAAWLWKLIDNSGNPASWHVYAERLERVADLRNGMTYLLDKLNEVIYDSRRYAFES